MATPTSGLAEKPFWCFSTFNEDTGAPPLGASRHASYVLQEMKMSVTERANEAHGINRLAIYLSGMRKRPGMYFGEPPYLKPLHSFLLGYRLAEECHEPSNRHFPDDGFLEWLILEKGFSDSNLGWPGMIESTESDEDAQLRLAIDLLAEYASIPLIDEADA